MDKKKIFLIIQSILCAVITVLPAVFALIIYSGGLAAKAADPTAWIYSRELAGKYLLPVLPIAVITLVMALVGILLGIRDEKLDKPVKGIEMKKRATKNEAEQDGTAKGVNTATIVRLIVLAAAVVLIIIGIVNGSARDVLFKAVTICTECVGLG